MKSSVALEIVLWIKITFTVIFWSLPLLLISASGFQQLGIPSPEPLLFVRLLGTAFFALLVGYILGVRDLRYQKDITNVVWMGIVSNGMASIVLLYFGRLGTWREWSNLGQTFMWLSAILAGTITIGLIFTGLIAGGCRFPVVKSN